MPAFNRAVAGRFPIQYSFPKAHRMKRHVSAAAYTAAKPFSRSAMMSSMCSVPMERRMVFWWMPAASSSSSVSCEWVVVAGWITRDFTSATFASSENIFKPSMKRNASSFPPLISNVNIEPPPLGKYFYTAHGRDDLQARDDIPCRQADDLRDNRVPSWCSPHDVRDGAKASLFPAGAGKRQRERSSRRYL